MTKSTKHRPWPAMAHSKPTSWQPARSSRKRDAALKPQIDLDDVAFLPEQHRPPPPEPTTRLLRNVGVCGGVAVLLFATFAFISVTFDAPRRSARCLPPQHQPVSRRASWPVVLAGSKALADANAISSVDLTIALRASQLTPTLATLPSGHNRLASRSAARAAHRSENPATITNTAQHSAQVGRQQLASSQCCMASVDVVAPTQRPAQGTAAALRRHTRVVWRLHQVEGTRNNALSAQPCRHVHATHHPTHRSQPSH